MQKKEYSVELGNNPPRMEDIPDWVMQSFCRYITDKILERKLKELESKSEERK